MGYIYTGEKGIPLREIIEKLGNKNYTQIICRCKYEDYYGEMHDEFFGGCRYENGELIPLDGDSYSLDDLYEEWEEDGEYLTVWESGRYSEVWE